MSPLPSELTNRDSKKKLPRPKIELKAFFLNDRIGIEALKKIVMDLLSVFVPLIERNHPFIVA